VKAVRKPAKAATAARKPKAATAARKPKAGAADASSEALRLAAAIDGGVHSGRPAISEAAAQKLLAALCKAYAQQVQAGTATSALGRNAVSATEVMITASGLLKAADLQVFELGMWQSWTGR
jgi:hypothetical protein